MLTYKAGGKALEETVSHNLEVQEASSPEGVLVLVYGGQGCFDGQGASGLEGVLVLIVEGRGP